MTIREAGSGDYREIVDLNAQLVHFLSPMDLGRLESLHDKCELLWVVEEGDQVVAFLLAFTQGADYDSVNYQWFNGNIPEFLYIDRVVVAPSQQGKGLGKALYGAIKEYGVTRAIPCLTAEIDIEPPNPVSLDFHKGFGFVEVGRQSVADGKKVVSLQKCVLDRGAILR